MRILKVRFKNLNSLTGGWEIDFTHPAFASDNIFAITGPTGAGKTSILDAICLALYGRTPRLSKVTKSTNDIMSRQTGACFAEVSFETQAGRYRCHWSQHRARKKPDGELQSPKHEIADADTGQIYEARLRAVAEQIEAVTGMDFDRFTRSMLLAQGGFAAFLQAAPDERAPILEQITGTEIYSRISMRVHERRSEVYKKLDTLRAELNGLQLLSEDDERQLNASLARKLIQEDDLNQMITGQNQAIAWLDGISGFEKELSLIRKQQQELFIRQEAFQPEREKLQCANQALELAGDYAGLCSLRAEQETDLKNLDRCRQAIPRQDAEVRRAEEILRRAGENLARKKIEQKEAQGVLRNVRELDLKIREKQAPIDSAESAVADQAKALDELSARHAKDCRELEKKKKALSEIMQQLSATSVDQGLVEHLSGINSRLEALENLQQQLKDKADESKAAATRQKKAKRLWSEQAATLKTRQQDLEVIRDTLARKQLEHNNLLESKEIAAWRDSLSALKERKSLLGKAGELAQTLADDRHKLEELNSRHDSLTVIKTDIGANLKIQVEQQGALERELQLLETQFSLLKKIQDFEQARQHLKDDEPCPLCGAREHPFAQGNVPVPDETVAALNRVRADLKKVNDTVAGLKVSQAETLKDLEQIAVRQKECTGAISDTEVLIKQSCRSLALEADDRDLKKVLTGLQKDNEDALDNTEKTVKAADDLDKEIRGLKESFETMKEDVIRLEQETQKAAYQMDSAQQTLETLKKDAGALDASLRKDLDRLHQEISVYGIEGLSADDLDQVRHELKARRGLWLDRQKEKEGLARDISSLESEIRHQGEQLNQFEAELKKQKEQLGKLQRERERLVRQRRELFADKDPDEEEYRLAVAIEAAEKNRDDSSNAFNAAGQASAKLKNQAEALEKSMAIRADRIKTAEEAFQVRLGALGFADERIYQQACLPEDQRKALLQQAQQLAREQTELEARQRDKTTQLEIERAKQLTDTSREVLDQERNKLANSHKELQQEIGAIRQKLKDNESLRQKQQAHAMAVDAQKRECTRWDALHELIGSADGKKYRNFAQGLTFDMMIGHANRQLQKMTDRYLLMRDHDQPLELNVVDNYQAGEIRTTKNLSGGESFIVSLSLALGLSQMASKNVRVDSLFLDEGFGTLDEEALDMALETLAGLQQDGKMIGVISHVPALKERIGNQIQVIPQTGGRSVISGPGCQAVSD